MKLLYDVQNNKWYNENGECFSSDNPAIPYGNAERVEIQLYAEVKGTNSGSEAVADWTKFTGFTGSGYGAMLATDNNFLHWYKAKLATALSAGTIATGAAIDITTSESVDNIAETGNFYVYDSDGDNEGISYSSRSAISGGIRFIAAAGNVLSSAYAVDSQADVPEMLYAEAAMIASASDPATGLFAFDFICDSTKLRNKMQYSSVERIEDCKGLELTVFQTQSNNTISVRKRILCSTFRITGGISDIRSGVSVPVPEQNQILVILQGFLSRGFEIQGSTDKTTWINYAQITDFQSLRWFRIRYNGSNSWSDAIPLIVGPAGPQGALFSYVAYASDTSGTNFTMTWEETAESNLKYIAFKFSSTAISTPTASDFAGLWTRFCGLDLRSYWDEGGEEEGVDWDDITNKPSTFPPSSHTHTQSILSDKARQIKFVGSDADTLYIDKDIIQKSVTHATATLAFSFPNLKQYTNGAYSDYDAVDGDVFTWELWINTTSRITSFTVPSDGYTKLLPGFPAVLELVNAQKTRHVFTVRGEYNALAPNCLAIDIHYAYSKEA